MAPQQTAPPAAQWHGAAPLAAVLLALPLALAAATATIYVATAGRAPPPVPMGLVYAAGCWLAVLSAWRWAARRGLTGAVFAFRRPRWCDWLGALAGLAASFAIFPLSQALTSRLGIPMHGMRYDLADPWNIAALVAWVVVTTPICEEVLFRGLAVGALRSRRWPEWAVALVPTVAYALVHAPYFGWGGAVFILFWGAIPMALRLWRGSLTPGAIMHAANNLAAFVIVPMLAGGGTA